MGGIMGMLVFIALCKMATDSFKEWYEKKRRKEGKYPETKR